MEAQEKPHVEPVVQEVQLQKEEPKEAPTGGVGDLAWFDLV